MCGSHQGAKTIAHRTLKVGFYWPTMKEDAKALVKWCVKCQMHSKIPHQPAQPMKSIFSPWPFDVWGIDLIGKISTGLRQVKYIVVVIDYFTKWVEAKALGRITFAKIIQFVKSHVFCRFGVPSAIFSDNGTQFTSQEFIDWCVE